MNNKEMISQLMELKNELFDRESVLLRQFTPNGQYDTEGHKMREIARARIYREAIDKALSQLNGGN